MKRLSLKKKEFEQFSKAYNKERLENIEKNILSGDTSVIERDSEFQDEVDL